MPRKLSRIRVLLLEVPQTAKLAYCLLRDDRVPVAPKVALGAAVGLAAGPRRLRSWIPVIGDLDLLALGVLTVRVFVDACPDQLVEAQRAAVKKRESVFDQDLRTALVLVRMGIANLLSRRESQWSGRASRNPGAARVATTEDESA